jgi:hypothetical protein
LRLTFADADTGQWRIGEHAEGHEAIAGAALATGQIVANDLKVINGDVRELGAAGTLEATRPVMHIAFEIK